MNFFWQAPLPEEEELPVPSLALGRDRMDAETDLT